MSIVSTMDQLAMHHRLPAGSTGVQRQPPGRSRWSAARLLLLFAALLAGCEVGSGGSSGPVAMSAPETAGIGAATEPDAAAEFRPATGVGAGPGAIQPPESDRGPELTINDLTDRDGEASIRALAASLAAADPALAQEVLAMLQEIEGSVQDVVPARRR